MRSVGLIVLDFVGVRGLDEKIENLSRLYLFIKSIK
jgi:hypothetical protein